jgi:hypothetical protein
LHKELIGNEFKALKLNIFSRLVDDTQSVVCCIDFGNQELAYQVLNKQMESWESGDDTHVSRNNQLPENEKLPSLPALKQYIEQNFTNT